MKPIIINYYTLTRWEKRKHKLLTCAKCGKELKNEDKGFKTARQYYCQKCGENAEINA